MIALLHPPGLAWRPAARRAAGALAAALGGETEPRPFAPGERESAAAGSPPAGTWALLPGTDLVRVRAFPRDRAVVLPRRDPRWSLEDLLRRPLDRLPAGARVVVPSPLGEALLGRARPDLVPVRAGVFPVAEETPALAEGPFDGGAGEALDPNAFVPAPGTGIDVLVAPGEEPAPAEVRAAEDAEARTALDIERALVEGVGALPAGASFAARARRKVSVLFEVRAVLFVPGAGPRDLRAEIPLADARTFARAFGRYLASRGDRIPESP